jgi:hypothetical protein
MSAIFGGLILREGCQLIQGCETPYCLEIRKLAPTFPATANGYRQVKLAMVDVTLSSGLRC